MRAALLIARFAALQLTEQIDIIRIARFKRAGGLRMVERDGVVADLVVCKSAVIVPLSSALLYLFKHVQTLAKITVLNIIECGTHVLLVSAFLMRLIIAAERIALSAAEAPELTAERIAAET